MKYNVFSIPTFENQLKRLAKKYPSLKTEFSTLVNELEENPFKGAALGNNCYKIRLAIASKRRGKSSGARVITHIYIENKTVFLLAIYDKSEQADIANKELKELLSQIK
jgi:mRNA-degrading endonuclease RelE of RelBE toxin-antitoxin system